MAKEHSMDISGKVDKQELKNAVYQVDKEISTRYDFKGIEKDIKEVDGGVLITTDSENKCDVIYDIFVSKAVKREIPTKAFNKGDYETIGGGKVKLPITVNDSLSSEDSKKIVSEIKALKLKVTASIQGETVRVKGKNIDDLQAVMAMARSLEEINTPLVFENFK
ncbi:MAG: YajQ family cyclic di-GMP-binding protein [Campylobacterales bacterium]|nr:YajQ family cyclic di-GMP-binding protein [Campylobacterales bacterium]